MYGDTTNVEHKMYDYSCINWSHWNNKKKFTKNLKAMLEKHSIDSVQKTAIVEHHT
jgi:thiosulfate reductase cytochrome b subunit